MVSVPADVESSSQNWRFFKDFQNIVWTIGKRFWESDERLFKVFLKFRKIQRKNTALTGLCELINIPWRERTLTYAKSWSLASSTCNSLANLWSSLCVAWRDWRKSQPEAVKTISRAFRFLPLAASEIEWQRPPRNSLLRTWILV